MANSNLKETATFAISSLATGLLAYSIGSGFAQKYIHFADELNEMAGFIVLATLSVSLLIAAVQSIVKTSK